MHYIILFCSRNNALKFSDALKREGVGSDLISTPKGAGKSCGLAVKVFDYDAAKRVLSYSNYPSYNGILRTEQENGRVYYTKID